MGVKRWIICAAALLAACRGAPQEGDGEPKVPAVNVFVVAHEDDWQLFMNPAAFHAMNDPGQRAVFVHLTAGDAGRGTSGEPVPYYLAREEGALRAIRFMANARPKTGLGREMEHSIVSLNGHRVPRTAYPGAAAYFLRLPDGNVTGVGFPTTGAQSLERLRTGQIPQITSVDGSASYRSWDDLVATLAAIVESEQVAGWALRLHVPETDAELNPEDHSDHLNSARAIEAAAGRFPCATVTRYDEYATGDRPINVQGADYLVDVGTWAATASGLSDSHAVSTWDPTHNRWLGRSYSRTTAPGNGCEQPR